MRRAIGTAAVQIHLFNPELVCEVNQTNSYALDKAHALVSDNDLAILVESRQSFL